MKKRPGKRIDRDVDPGQFPWATAFDMVGEYNTVQYADVRDRARNTFMLPYGRTLNSVSAELRSMFCIQEELL